jgi:LPXTG-motif cell wall-anchored protein
VNLLKSPLRRTTAALAGAFIGLAGAVAFAAPASAGGDHSSELTGTTDCLEDGGWTVDWTLTPKHAPIDGKIVKVEETPGGSDLKNIVKDAKVPAGGTLTDSQTFGKDVAEVTLSVKIAWVYEESDAADVTAANATTTGGDWKPGDDKGGWKPGDDHGGWQPGDHGNVVFDKVEATVKAPEDCEQPGQPPTIGEAKPIFEVTCDTMTIGLDNPKNGIELTLRFKTSKGEERVLVVKPGEKKAETFSATPGFSVKLTVEAQGEKSSGTIPFEQPEGCANGGVGGGGGLPVTGAAAGSIAGGAAVLLIAGGAMFVLARRRKVKFTA